jgi:radical SAM superfamily enzyme YgiQ (UPF0313 family)
VVATSDEHVDGDLAIVLSSLVDYRAETAWAEAQRARGSRVGFIGLAASKMPELFDAAADFVVMGEPEHAAMRLARGEMLAGRVVSDALDDLDVLPFPRWDLLAPRTSARWWLPFAGRPFGGAFPLLASRGCPEFCTYCPHRILAGHRARSVQNIVDEIAYVSMLQSRPYIVFRDPLFTENRDRAMALADAIRSRGLDIRFECETRLDRLDTALLDALHSAGLAAISFGVETVSPETLKKSGRRPIPDAQQRRIVEACRERGIVTAGYFVFGFLQDTWESIAASVSWAVDLGPTVAQFKILTPYPGTPMWKQLAPLVYERDWQKFDGYTATFRHPSLTPDELQYLLGAAYTRFYMRPSYLANYLRLHGKAHRAVTRFDPAVSARHELRELADMSRALTC